MTGLAFTALQHIAGGIRGGGQEEAAEDHRFGMVILAPTPSQVTDVLDQAIGKGLGPTRGKTEHHHWPIGRPQHETRLARNDQRSG